MKLPREGTVGIDTSALLGAFSPYDESHDASRRLLAAIRDGRVRGRVSTVAAAESLVRPLRQNRHAEVLLRRAVLQGLPNLEIQSVDWAIAIETARIRAAHAIQLPDALIVAAALSCDAFASSDWRALAVAEAEGLATVSLVRV